MSAHTQGINSHTERGVQLLLSGDASILSKVCTLSKSNMPITKQKPSKMTTLWAKGFTSVSIFHYWLEELREKLVLIPRKHKFWKFPSNCKYYSFCSSNIATHNCSKMTLITITVSPVSHESVAMSVVLSLVVSGGAVGPHYVLLYLMVHTRSAVPVCWVSTLRHTLHVTTTPLILSPANTQNHAVSWLKAPVA